MFDDGSTDDSLKILKTFENERIRIITQENSGATSARNRGLNNSHGEYVMFVDSDDFIPYNSIDNLLDEAYKSEADIVTGNIGQYIEKMNCSIYPNNHKRFEKDDLLIMCSNTQGAPWERYTKKIYGKAFVFMKDMHLKILLFS